MSYDCIDGYSDLTAEFVKLGLVSARDWGEQQAEETALCLAALRRLAAGSPRKAGIRRIRKTSPRPHDHAELALSLLRQALRHARYAGACYTAARIRSAVSSAKGAVRAAGYREMRGRP